MGHVGSIPLTIFNDPQLEGRVINFSSGEVICDEKALANFIYYINRGQVRLYSDGSNHSRRLLGIMGTGQWFGAEALAGVTNYQKHAIAIGSVVITEVRVEQLLLLLEQQPQQLIELNRQLARRLLIASEVAGELVFEDCNQRLISTLLRFSRSAASTPHEDGVTLRITHDQLAQAIGVARETVSLALTQLRQQNLLRTGRNQLVFNPDALLRTYRSAMSQLLVQSVA
jgi:CRP-like cAMP-binding protein